MLPYHYRFSAWIVLNALGVTAYLYLASNLWASPSEQGTVGGPGDAFYWLFPLAPLISFFALTNLLILPSVIRQKRMSGKFTALIIWLMTIFLWFSVIFVDYLLSARVVARQYT